MGDKNQVAYLWNFLQREIEGPVLEIGSRKESHANGYRHLFPDVEYIGLDMQEGTDVDVVHDITTGIGPLKEDYFDLVICPSVLEHVDRPWLAAEVITQVTKGKGILYLSVPWMWKYHGYPADYWRISPKAFPVLFPDFEWGKMHATGNKEGISPRRINENPTGFDLFFKKNFFAYAPTMVNAIGVKK